MIRPFAAMLCLLLGPVWTEAGTSGEGDADIPVIKSETREFRIPLNVAPEKRDRYQSVELWHSGDEGKTWQCVDRVKPDAGSFVYRAIQDGMHWFTIRARATDGRSNPEQIADLRPKLKVLIEASNLPETEPVPATATPPEAAKSREGEAKIPIIKTERRKFRIPLNIWPEEQDRLESVELWHSGDEGKTWQCADQVKPDAGTFVYRASQDGMHWFTVRGRATDGRANPEQIVDLRPSLKVLIGAPRRPETSPEPAPAPPAPEKPIDYRVLAYLAKSRASACGFAGLR